MAVRACRRGTCVFVLGAALIALVRVAAAQEAAAQEVSAPRSVWDGVYTEDQARRGETQYGRNCQACHGSDLSGSPVDEVPSLAWDGFLTQWNNRTVKDLFDTVKRSMPKDNPGGLNARAYVDVIAYLLQSNKFPSGSRDLSLNTDALAQIVIEKNKK
ncbi:MAG: cytochrome c [Acidobacteriota bacterium]